MEWGEALAIFWNALVARSALAETDTDKINMKGNLGRNFLLNFIQGAALKPIHAPTRACATRTIRRFSRNQSWQGPTIADNFGKESILGSGGFDDCLDRKAQALSVIVQTLHLIGHPSSH